MNIFGRPEKDKGLILVGVLWTKKDYLMKACSGATVTFFFNGYCSSTGDII
jgi:hypothetical protein